MDTLLSMCYFGGNLIFKVLSGLVEILEVEEGARRILCVWCNDFKRSEDACWIILNFCDHHVFAQ